MTAGRLHQDFKMFTYSLERTDVRIYVFINYTFRKIKISFTFIQNLNTF